MNKINEIKIYKLQNDTSIKLVEKLYSYDPRKKISQDIKNIIKNNINNIDIIIEEMTKEFSNERLDNTVDYIHYLFVYDTLGYIIYVVNSKDDVLVDYKKIVLNKTNSGNCIDDFIERGVYPNIEAIEKYCDDICMRKFQRMNNNEYHQTSCYEYDFSQIMKIKQIATKIIKNCDRQLEAISEKYTKM